MKSPDRINVGVVGVCGAVGRGAGMISAINNAAPLNVRAVCDIDTGRLEETRARFGVEAAYADYEEMLDKGGVDAVFIATPMNLHVSQSVAALQRGIHVLCEVTAAVTVEECRELVAACKESDAVYMMAENYIYDRPAACVAEMVRRGLFGTPYYAEGGYVAEIKGLEKQTPWRRKWQLGVNGITYIAHNIGPMLEWMPGERVVRVCCSGAGRRYTDTAGIGYEAEASCTMLGKTSGGGQIVIRSDFLSNRPEAGIYNCLQGTEGCYESPRYPGDTHRVWLKSMASDRKWTDLGNLMAEFSPAYWQDAVAADVQASGTDFQCVWFADAILDKAPNPIDVHRALDMTLPGLISQLSIEREGEWMDVPDSREW